MTLGRLSAFATGAITLASLALFITTGAQVGLFGMLLAPLPALIVYGLMSEWADWTIADLLGRTGTDADVEHQLGEALAPPLDLSAPDDDAYLLPGLPRHPEDA